MNRIIKNVLVMFLFFFVMTQINAADQTFEDFPLIQTKNGVLDENEKQKRFDLWRSADRKSVVLKETCLHPDGLFTVKEVPLLTLKKGNVVGVAASTKTFSSRYRDTLEVVIFVDGRKRTIKATVGNILDVFNGKETVKWSGDHLFHEFVFDKEPKFKTIKDIDVLWGIQEFNTQELPSLFGGYTVPAIDDKAPQKSTKTSKLFLLFCCLLSVIALQQGHTA